MVDMRALRSSSAFDGERFRPEGATVIYDGETIVGVEPAAYDVPDNCEVTTYDGTLLPGLFDCHVHLVSDASIGSLERSAWLSEDDLDAVIIQSLRQQAVAGVTTVRDLGDVGYRTLAHRDAKRAGAPRIVAAGPPLTVPEGHCHYLGGDVAGEAEVRDSVREHADRGVDVIKVMASGGMVTTGSDVMAAQFTADELRTAVHTAHELGLKVLAHAHSVQGIEHALAAGVDGLEHFTGLTEQGPVISDELLARVAAAGLPVCLTMGNDNSVLDRMPSPPPHIQAVMERMGIDVASFLESRLDVARRAGAAGVRVVNGVDAGAAPTKRHGNAWRAVLDLVTGAWQVPDALATATSVAAEECDVPAGRLRPGLAADLLVVDGDLQTDPTALSRPVEVVVRGRMI